MALRSIRTSEDTVLKIRSKEVDVVNDRILMLLDDMAETMYADNGVGLAAPQIGILRRVAVIDDGNGLIELINPMLVSYSGEQTSIEGCLSIPGVFGEVKRPKKVTVKALSRTGKTIKIKAEDLLARALCHEIDHLDGILFTDKAIRLIDPSEIKERQAVID